MAEATEYSKARRREFEELAYAKEKGYRIVHAPLVQIDIIDPDGYAIRGATVPDRAEEMGRALIDLSYEMRLMAVDRYGPPPEEDEEEPDRG